MQSGTRKAEERRNELCKMKKKHRRKGHQLPHLYIKLSTPVPSITQTAIQRSDILLTAYALWNIDCHSRHSSIIFGDNIIWMPMMNVPCRTIRKIHYPHSTSLLTNTFFLIKQSEDLLNFLHTLLSHWSIVYAAVCT